ncbi:MAG: NAD(P)/FAD-dependent oxidoreductase [Candidatus Diapherotrites archaeon]|nr:NAD(P)/FAD-dependent oxidoreductase [Candidatus Diapherotrites archaeon]
MCAVFVAGAGPAGIMTASELSKNGWDVTLIEEHPNVGTPEHCAGLLSVTGLRELGINANNCTVNEINGAEIFSPSGHKILVEKDVPVALVISRKEFDLMLLKDAIKNGVKVEFESKLIDVRKENIFIQKKNRGELRKAKVVVGADGVNSRTREIIGVKPDKSHYLNSYQIRANGSFESKKVKLYLGSFAKGFFAWIIPENNSIARIGIATSFGINPKEAFDEFKKKYLLDFEKIEESSFKIPCGPPINEPINNNILLVGDAAFHAKATTGGGIIMGLNAAKICARAIDSNFRNNTGLENYKFLLKPITKELILHWKMRSYLNKLSENTLDKLFIRAQKANLGEFLSEHGDMDWPSRFIPKMLSKPRFWGFLPMLLRFR